MACDNGFRMLQPRRHPEDPDERRRRLWRLASPIFRTHGYRGTTMKAVAHACGITAPALYRHFSSKLALALYPLQPGHECKFVTAFHEGGDDPYIAIRGALDSQLPALNDLLLALRIAGELHDSAEAQDVRTYAVHHLQEGVAEVVRAFAPHMPPDRAAEVARAMVNVAIASVVVGADPPLSEVRRGILALLRGYLLPLRVDARRFDAVVA